MGTVETVKGFFCLWLNLWNNEVKNWVDLHYTIVWDGKEWDLELLQNKRDHDGRSEKSENNLIYNFYKAKCKHFFYVTKYLQFGNKFSLSVLITSHYI